jgi:hypothetical protein
MTYIHAQYVMILGVQAVKNVYEKKLIWGYILNYKNNNRIIKRKRECIT